MTADRTKVIIITSNEDLIQQIRFNKSTNTRIIDLDNNEQGSSTINDDSNIMDLAFLAQLSDPNSKNEGVFKRALDSADHTGTKPAKVPKKPMICAICGGRAIGNNYDVPSCSSCKAFFRRHANQSLDKMRCITGQNQCSLSYETRRRKCQKCRINRCLTAGMKKDFMFSEEEKQRRRKHLEEKRNPSIVSNVQSLPQTSNETDHINSNGNDDLIATEEDTDLNGVEDILWETLSIEDWLTIESVRCSFLSTFGPEDGPSLNVDVPDSTSALITLSQSFHRITQRFISFFREIHEFDNLHSDDRFVLIKYSIYLLFIISKCFYYKPAGNSYSNEDNEHAIKVRRFFALCGVAEDAIRTFSNIVPSLVELTGQDPGTLSLLATIVIFSHGLSMNDDEPLLKDPAVVYQAQTHYTNLFWKYLISRRGESQAVQYFTQLMALILRMQSMSKQFREFFRAQYMSYNLVDRMAPLMQTVLHMS